MINWATGRPPVQPVLVKKCSPYKKKTTQMTCEEGGKKRNRFTEVSCHILHMYVHGLTCVSETKQKMVVYYEATS